MNRPAARIDALIEKKRRQIELFQEKRSALISHVVTKGLDPNAPMKDSGIEWLSKIPAHWEAKRLRFLVSEPLKYGANESAELDDPDLPRYIRITDVDENGRLREDTFKSLPEDVARAYLLKEGDLLLARSGATVGKSFYYEPSWGRAAYAGYLIRARFNPARVMPRFVNYFTNSQQYWQWLGSSFIQATIQNVSAEKYANLIVPVPPVDEQRAIAAFLDRETARIDGLIEKKRRQIELLQEKRSAVISHAVTKGLDPNAPMKDSGIEWLGKIPAHWEIHRLKHVASVQFSSVDKHTLEGEEPVRLCNYVDVYYNDFIAAGIEFMSASATQSEIARFQLCRGDVLVTKDSESWDDIAVPSYVAEKLDGVLCGYHLAHIRPHPRMLLGEYLFRAFRSRGINDQFRVAANGITRFGLGKYWLDNGLFPVPPLPEQRAIAAFLDRETARIDGLVKKVNNSIETLREYRTAMISAAVTGKIDVRKEVD